MALPSCSGRPFTLQQVVKPTPFITHLSRPATSYASGSKSWRLAAADDKQSSDVKPEVPMISSKEIGPIPFSIDNESFTDVMAFTGPAPERVNGRVAMWAFLVCSLTEVTSGQSVAQQAAAHPVSAAALGAIISLASLAPKYVSGVPLDELQNAASRDGLPEKLRFFNKTHEIWLGRVAMIGILGLTGLEVYLGHALFKR